MRLVILESHVRFVLGSLLKKLTFSMLRELQCLKKCRAVYTSNGLSMSALQRMLVVVASLVGMVGMVGAEFTCESVGFYPAVDCSVFYRCTDLWGTGQFQQYTFQCAEGTVFDSSLGVCNWPQVCIHTPTKK